MEDFKKAFEIIYKKFEEDSKKRGLLPSQISKAALRRFLGVSNGKAVAWESGQWPSAKDCAMLSEMLGLSLHWLVTGEGDPEGPDAPCAPLATAAGPHEADQLVDLAAEVARLKAALATETERRRAAEAAAQAAKDELLDLYRERAGKPRLATPEQTATHGEQELRETPAGYPDPKGLLQEAERPYPGKKKHMEEEI